MARIFSPARSVLRPPVAAEHVLFLKWLVLAVVTGFGLIAAWHYGLAGRVWAEDPTRITPVIVGLCLLTFGVGGVHTFRLSRALNHTATVERWMRRRESLPPGRGASGADQTCSDEPLPEGRVVDHLRRLWRRAEGGGGGHDGAAGDRALLFQAFEAQLRRGQDLVWFVADLLLTLGLIGTVVGFIAMLAPLAGLDPTDAAAMKRAIGAMSGGMAVALYTTLAGLVGGLLLRVEGLFLDEAAEEVVRRTTELAELRVGPLTRPAAWPPAEAIDAAA